MYSWTVVVGAGLEHAAAVSASAASKLERKVDETVTQPSAARNIEGLQRLSGRERRNGPARLSTVSREGAPAMSIHFRASLVSLSALVLASAAHADNAPASEIVVTAPREETVAREKQMAAPNLLNIQSAETILKYPDFNAAEALGRIPGISISTDTGEGRFVNIRGIDGNLAGATFGGVPLLNTNPGGTYFGGGGRAVEYDTIPTGSIDGIIVYKTTLPDHEAEGLGGSVDLTPRTALNVARPFAEATLGYGYEPAHDHGGPLNAELVVGGQHGPFALVATASWRSDRRGFDDIEEDYNDPTVDRSYADIQLRRYDYHRRRFGYGGEADFKPNEDHRFYLRANIAGYIESVKKNRLTYDDLGDDPDPHNPTGFSTTTDINEASTDEQESHRNQVYVLGGEDHWGDMVLDYRGSYSRATFHVSKNYGAKFNGPQALPFTYDNSKNNGDFPVLIGNDALVNDPANWSPIKKVSNSTEDDKDSEWAGAANLVLPVRVFNDMDRIKIGGEVRLRDKTSTPSAFSSALSSPLPLSQASDPAITDFYAGHYTNGPNINIDKVRAAAQAGTTTGGVDISSLFTAKEDIYAGYAQYQGEFGKLGVLAGVRVEATRAKYGAYSDDNADQTLEFVERPMNYTNAFPTVQLKYRFTNDMQLRLTYSTGIGRPGFLQNSAITSSNHDPTDPQIVTGNPNLKPTTGNNFDLSFEYYLPKGGILQVGAFDKEFSNYIVDQFQRRLYTGTDPTFQGLMVGYTTFANRGGAWARGLEAAYHQQFLFLPGFWSGFGLDANVTLVDSHILEYDAATSATGHDESGLLPGTSRLTWNAAAFYEDHGLQLRIAAEYVSKELFSLGGSKATDTIQDHRLTVDFTSSYQVTKTWTVYFNVKNITNEPLRFYVNNSSFPIQREFYEQTFEAGIRARF
jgi:TonB-dependent receptor